jgi:hypothetical protein
MRYKEIGIGMGRTIRLEKYNFIRPDAWLLAEIGPDENPDVVLDEMRKDLRQLLQDLEQAEAQDQGFIRDGKSYLKLELEGEIEK